MESKPNPLEQSWKTLFTANVAGAYCTNREAEAAPLEWELKRAGGEVNLEAFTTLLQEAGSLDKEDVLETVACWGGEKQCLARFLSARDGNHVLAKEMFDDTVAYRRTHRVSALWGIHEGVADERLGPIAAMRPLWSGFYVGMTKDGSPVQYNRVEFLEPSRLLGSLAQLSCPALLPSSLAQLSCPALLPSSLAQYPDRSNPDLASISLACRVR